MKHLLTSAAMALVLGTGAFAQTATTTDTAPDAQVQAGADQQIMADDLIGMSIYTTAGQQPAPVEGAVDPQQQGWEEIGTIRDLVMTADGNIESVVVGVGGFIGMGERDVALPLEQVNVYQSDGADPVLVVTMTQEELEAQPEFEEGTQMGATGTGVAPAPATDLTADTTATDPAQTDAATTETVEVQTPEVDAQPDADAQMTAETDTQTDPATPEMAQAEVTEDSQEATQMAQDQLTEPGTAVEEDTAMDQDRVIVEGETDTAATDPATTAPMTDTMETDTAATTDTMETDTMATTDTMDTTETDTMATTDTMDTMETDTMATDTMEADTVETDTVTTDVQPTEPTTTDTVATAPATQLERPAMQREGYTERMVTDLTVDDLTGADVFGVGDENIGSIGDLIVTADGNISDAIINFGGFLGLGQNSVAVNFDELQILSTEDGTDVRVYINATQEQLEAMPEYQE
jgi:hypothetical protein